MRVYATYNRSTGFWKITHNRQTLAGGQGLDGFVAILDNYPNAATRWTD